MGNALANGLKVLARAFDLAARVVAALMFAAVFLIFCLKIVMRYGEHNEMAWADEVCIILFIWIIFWANAFILTNREHIKFDLVTHVVSPTVQRWMAVARSILVGGIFLFAAPATLDYIQFLWRERTPVLELRLDHVYICFGIFVVTVPIRAAWGLWRLAGKDWRSQL
jgi:TRAP-type C4-dicarboxylate transport system permease small subunit